MSENKDDTMAGAAQTQQGIPGDQPVDPAVTEDSDRALRDSPPAVTEDSDRAPSADSTPAVTSDVDATGEAVAADQVSSSTQLRLRRAPRYRPFGLTGAVFGVIAGVALALSFTAASDYSMQTIAGYFAAIFGLVGAVLGLGVAVLIERRRSERGRPESAPRFGRAR